MKVTGTLPLGADQLRGGGRLGDGQGLSLHRLPEADRHGVSRRHREPAGDIRAEERDAEDLPQDRGEREQARPRLLPEMRHADLCRRARTQPVNLWIAGRRDRPARSTRPAGASDLVPLGSALVDGSDRLRAHRTAITRRRRCVTASLLWPERAAFPATLRPTGQKLVNPALLPQSWIDDVFPSTAEIMAPTVAG
jgi:hypothetical protein